jgi:hypothetical protein
VQTVSRAHVQGSDSMAIKPVDFQVMIPRTMEASKISNDELQRNQSLQYQLAAAGQQEAEDSLKQVVSRPQAQNVRIAEKQSERRQGGGKKKKQGQNPSDDSKRKERLRKEPGSSIIDIKI